MKHVSQTSKEATQTGRKFGPTSSKGNTPLDTTQIKSLMGQLKEGWVLNKAGHLEKEYAFKDFAGAMAFANKITDLAETMDHHPDLHICWGKCDVEIWTHQVQGLSEKDFALAEKIERVH